MQARTRRSFAASLIVAAVLVVGFGMATAVLVGGTHTASAEKTQSKGTTTVASTARLTTLLHPNSASELKGKPKKADSANWAGYAFVPKTAGNITEVFSEWYVPTAVCDEVSGATSEVAWIGIDGDGSSTVQQIGTADYCSGPGATPSYYLWYEFYPATPITELAPTTPGAFVSAYVLYNPAEEYGGVNGVWTSEIFDVDNSQAFTVVATDYSLGYSPADASAECISEAPSSVSSILPLTDYGQVTFYACDVTNGAVTTGIGGFHGSVGTTHEITQVEGGVTAQTPGALSTYFGKDSTFTITWDNYT